MNISYDEDAFPSAQEPMDTATNVTPKTVTDLEPLSGDKEESVIKDVEMTKGESLSEAAEQKGSFYTKCYSPMCRNPGSEQTSESLKCYSPSCPHKVCDDSQFFSWIHWHTLHSIYELYTHGNIAAFSI